GEGRKWGPHCPSWGARARVAGVRRADADAAGARALADPILREAEGSAASPESLRCAAKAAAAINDAGRLAATLDAIAAREDALRYWSLQIDGHTGGILLRGREFPFEQIVKQPQVLAAKTRLDAAYARERAAADRTLA